MNKAIVVLSFRDKCFASFLGRTNFSLPCLENTQKFLLGLLLFLGSTLPFSSVVGYRNFCHISQGVSFQCVADSPFPLPFFVVIQGYFE